MPPDLLPVIAAQSIARQRVNQQVTALATQQAQQFTGWYASDEITAWAIALAALVEPYLRSLARSTDAYMARAVAQVAGRPFRPIGALDVSSLRKGVTHAGAYARAADVYRYQQSRLDKIALLAKTDVPRAASMLTLADPISAAVDRVAAVADMDTQLVVAKQSQATMAAGQDRGLVTHWRRVFRPELSIHGSCGLCISAADRVYKVSNLLPIHARCNCIPVPAGSKSDPGLELNKEDFAKLYGEAGSAKGSDLKKTRYFVDEHGELGPVLTANEIRTPSQVRRATNPDRQPKTAEQRHADVERIYGELSNALPKLRDLAHESPQQWDSYVTNMESRVSELEKELAAA